MKSVDKTGGGGSIFIRNKGIGLYGAIKIQQKIDSQIICAENKKEHLKQIRSIRSGTF